jgi:hypothetical protein
MQDITTSECDCSYITDSGETGDELYGDECFECGENDYETEVRLDEVEMTVFWDVA